MPRGQNFLLGHGDRMTSEVGRPRGAVTKRPPYTVEQSAERLASRAFGVAQAIAELPKEALAADEAIAVVTVHPRFVSKSDSPTDLLRHLKLAPVGSRSRQMVPERWGAGAEGRVGRAEDIFVRGDARAFANWSTTMGEWNDLRPTAGVWETLSHIEDVSVAAPESKLRGPLLDERGLLEIVLHGENEVVFRSFLHYLEGQGIEVLAADRQRAGGLTFVPVMAEPGQEREIARFSFVRVARSMPRMRPIPFARRNGGRQLSFPAGSPTSESLRAVIYDGGIPKQIRPRLGPWVTLFEPDDLVEPDPDDEWHGLAVTGAFLFGPAFEPLGHPVCRVEHVRILDKNSSDPADPVAFRVLSRISNHLASLNYVPDLINLSVGPQMALDDDEVSLWTSKMDEFLADGMVLVCAASGNDGHLDTGAGLHRVQPPADGVNLLSVGASDSDSPAWRRADYSSWGPGRMPGLVKPDGLSHGGSIANPFPLLDNDGSTTYASGTSFASPIALRACAGVRAAIGDRVDALTTRALMVHFAQRHEQQTWHEVGWGRFELDVDRLITCEDDEATVLYRGWMPLTDFLRVPLAVPDGAMTGMIEISATMVVASEVDAEHSASYTRGGLEVFFRPDASRYAVRDGRRSTHPTTNEFFGAKRVFDGLAALAPEEMKWEPVRRATIRKRAALLNQPVFDVYYNHRLDGRRALNPNPLPYAFVVTMRAKSMKDFYSRVLRAHAGRLAPLVPQTRVTVGGFGAV